MILGKSGVTVMGMSPKQYVDVLIKEIEAYGRQKAADERIETDSASTGEQGEQEAEDRADSPEALQSQEG